VNRVHFDVTIVGSGIIGLTAAVALKKQGWSVGIISQSALKKKNTSQLSPQVCALNRPSEHLFRQIGLWDQLDAKDYDHVLIWDSFHKEDVLFSGAECAEPNLGHIVENQKMYNALVDQVRKHSIPVIIDTLVDLKPGATCLISCQQQTITTQLVIGADGKQSWVRQHLGFGYVADDYAQTALVGLIKHQSPHFNTARQRFFPNGTLALLPLNDPCSSAMIWSLPTDEAKKKQLKPLKAFNLDLETAWHARLGQMQLEGQLFHYPLSSLHTRKYGQPGVVIVGDAAHVIHPLAGQGLNLGLSDISALLSCIHEYDLGSQQLVDQYTEKRHLENIATLKMMDVLQLVFWPQHPVAVRARALGLRLLDALVPLKRSLSLFALGYRPDLSVFESLLERLKR
tara:strand:- start:1837 stop:3030 length:1194 start_codon:yes stop_codon:yes gene_type:complete